MPQLPRLRQAVLAAIDLDATKAQLEDALGVRDAYPDPGVREFGLQNAVYELGDTFLEIVSPIRENTAAGRYIDRRGGDAGYMAIFQVADTDETRKRVADLDIRIVWQGDLDDISGTHLHPADVPGAIVSFDTPKPAETWHWAGPRWTGGTPDAPHIPDGRLAGITVAFREPDKGRQIWSDMLGIDDVGAIGVDFTDAQDERSEGIVEIRLAGVDLDAGTTIAGVQFTAT